MLSLELPCWLALSKVTWPHLLLACSKLNPGWLADTNQKTRAQFFCCRPPKVVQTFTYSQSCTACLVAVSYGDTSVRSLFRCLSRTVSEIRSAAASSIHAARGGSHGARYQTRCRRHGNRAPLQPIKTPPLLSPLVTAAARGASRARTPSIFFSPPFFRRRANVAFTSTLSRVRFNVYDGRGGGQ